MLPSRKLLVKKLTQCFISSCCAQQRGRRPWTVHSGQKAPLWPNLWSLWFSCKQLQTGGDTVLPTCNAPTRQTATVLGSHHKYSAPHSHAASPAILIELDVCDVAEVFICCQLVEGGLVIMLRLWPCKVVVLPFLLSALGEVWDQKFDECCPEPWNGGQLLRC